ncbi:LysM peptidoglycan-binding domain-containing protein [Ferrimonas sediminicola]|uniref:LysM peptidoglycan-binding domain-containing protein n=1 Tax=Ferrimonas sediminicola TaxID=2569538 RepID=A0A4U1B8W6_9GAMM|nr:LysM domain-containing protein [Ferrimonas sediminicola]TKB46969.1 LysM peptidoglycan-binding domain-containing protein [Ferrimonas sediminicola]
MRRVPLLFLLILSLAGWAESLSLRPGSPKVYTVKQGDTLWSISSLYLNDPWQWPRLWRTNLTVSNPHLIYPGERLLLGLENGQPVLRREEGPMAGEPILTLDWASIRPRLARVRVVTAQALQAAPVVEAGSRSSLRFVAGDTLYLSHPLQPGGDYGVFRYRQSLNDPQSGKRLGEEMVLAAIGVANPSGQLRLLYSDQEVGPGEPLYALATLVADPLLVPLMAAPPDTDLALVATPSLAREVGPGELVYLSRENGVRPGQMLIGIHRMGPGAELKRGELVVVHCFARVCLALVTRGGHPLRLADRAVTPERRWRPR